MINFINLPIEIQVSVLRDYEKSLWTISRSLSKILRNATEFEFLKNEFRHPISSNEINKIIKNDTQSCAIFVTNYNCNNYNSYIFGAKNQFYSVFKYNGIIAENRGYHDLKVCTINLVGGMGILYQPDLLTTYNILSNRYSSKHHVAKAIIYLTIKSIIVIELIFMILLG